MICRILFIGSNTIFIEINSTIKIIEIIAYTKVINAIYRIFAFGVKPWEPQNKISGLNGCSFDPRNDFSIARYLKIKNIAHL